MYARVARWEGGDPEAIRKTAEEITSRGDTGPPEGVPSKGFTLLIDPDGGRALAIGLFETEEDYAKGDETLNAMDPPGPGMGTRGAVEKWQVGFDVRI
jgi:hypothetical protein